MKERILINVHSMVDLITNSSTELFCYIKGKTKRQIEIIIKSILEEYGCDGVDLYVDDDVWLWDNEKDEEYQDKNILAIYYDYEMHHHPCKMIINRLNEIFKENIIDRDEL